MLERRPQLNTEAHVGPGGGSDERLPLLAWDCNPLIAEGARRVPKGEKVEPFRVRFIGEVFARLHAELHAVGFVLDPAGQLPRRISNA